MVDVRQRALATVYDYYPDLKVTTQSRQVQSNAYDKENQLESLGQYLPKDWESRRLPASNVAGRSGDGSTQEATLKEALDQLAADFHEQIATLVPDPTPAMTLPFVRIQDGALLLDDDVSVDLASAQGIMMIEALNAQARGEDPELCAEAIRADLGALLDSMQDSTSRGMFSEWNRTTVVWRNNTVVYRWGNISAAHRWAHTIQ